MLTKIDSNLLNLIARADALQEEERLTIKDYKRLADLILGLIISTSCKEYDEISRAIEALQDARKTVNYLSKQ